MQPLLQWGKILYILSVCWWPWYAMRMRHIVICDLAGSTTFLILSHKRHDFLKTVTGHKMCVLIFSIIPYATFLVLRTERDMIINVHRSSCKVPVILVRF